MDVDFKITVWERVSIPEKFREEVEHALKNGKIQTANDLISMFEEDIDTPEGIPMGNVIDYYEGIDFADDDFFCSMDTDEDIDFPNGFASWQETHYEIVSMLTVACVNENSIITEYYETCGTGGMYELAEDWTFKFEEQTKDRVWDGEFFEEIEAFFDEQLNHLS